MAAATRLASVQMANTQLHDLIEECVARRGAHVIDIVQHGRGIDALVEVFIDTEVGVTSELCADVSREVARELKATLLNPGSYRLSVSSPGIGRPLKFPWQYKKHVGRELTIRWKAETGVIQTDGTLLSLDDTGILVEEEGGSAPTHIGFDRIVTAKVKAPW